VFESHELHNTIFPNTGEPTRGCHVAAHDWAMWHLHNQSDTATCQMLIRPLVYHIPILSACHCTCHIILLTSFHATCHPYRGDTCHPRTGPTHLLYALSFATCHLQMLPCQLYGLYSQPTTCTVRTIQLACHVDCTDCTVTPLFLPVWVFDQNAISFAYKAHLKK
jgi:hypothetical protein